MFDDGDSEYDLDDLNGGDGGCIDADRDVIDVYRKFTDEEDIEDGSEGEGDGDDRRQPSLCVGITAS